jgi:PASTA domain
LRLRADGPDGPGNPDDRNGAPAPWAHDGAVVKELSAPEVYLLFGGARFHVGSPDELVALGLSWAQVVTVADGALDRFDRVPDRGTMLRERASAEVWRSLGDRLCWIPTAEAMRLLGLSGAQVHTVPAGSLAAFPTTRLASASATPASMVFAPDPPAKWPRRDVPGFTLPNGARIVEVRGWLRAVDDGPNGSDPDWHLQIEPDPEWLDGIGVNWTTFFKVGDILMMGLDPLTDDADQHARVATPTLHLEVNGWQQDKHVGEAPPADWTVGEAQGGQLAGVIWPYLPTVSGGRPGNDALVVGEYVRAVGCLVSDIPHCHGHAGGFGEFWEHNFGIGPGSSAYISAAQDWEGAYTEFDEADPPRWTEIHPPDLIETLPSKLRTEAVYGVVAVARAAITNPVGRDQAVTVDLLPPADRPAHSKAAVQEFVGPETRFGSIVEGNADHSGAAITLFPDRAQVHVKVHGDGFAGAPGKFKAVYRLQWVPDPPAPSTTVPNVRELDRDTADAQVRGAGLVPAHIPSNADADTWVRHQTPAAGQSAEVGSVVTLQLQAGSPL